MVTIDAHLHLGEVPEHVPQWWVDELYAPFGDAEYDSADGQVIVDKLDQAGIDIGIVQASDLRRTSFHPDHPGQHRHFVSNTYVAEEVAKFPDRLVGEAAIDPFRNIQAAVLELERCVNELGFKGLKLVPTYQQYSPSDPRLDPIYEKCVELDIPCHIHMGWTPTIEALMKYQDPVLLDEVGVKFRDLKVIVAHLGYPWVDQAVALVAKHPNFYCEMAYWCGFGPEYLYQALFKLRAMGAIGRVIYGSENFCTTFFPRMYEEVNDVAERMGTAPFSEEEMANIMGGTAAKLYKIAI